jgi:pyruvate dehydrogenase E2 component (dihydrolipoamide acetyltransferase)
VAEFLMPILGADMEAGTLVAWLKQSGDTVKRGDIVAEVETEKGLIEVQIFTTGVIEKLLVQPGQTVPVGTPLAVIREEGAPAIPLVPAEVTPPAAAPLPSVVETPTPPAAAERLRISPLARKLAAELGVDPAAVHGTGPGGAITREDIQRAAPGRAPAAPAPAAPAARHGDLQAQVRQTIGAAMARSKREVPHYYLSTMIDLRRALDWLTEVNLRRSVTDRLLPGVLFIKAVALALGEVPELNAVWRGGQPVPSPVVHVGVAISLRSGGLVAPALHDTNHQSLDELMRAFRDLVKRVRAGTLRSSELSDPTITVTSLGDQGVEAVFGIIYPPQVAIVGFGRIVERPWVVDGQVVPRPVVTATLSADHRVTDGHRGGLFLVAVDRLLQEPARL